MKKIVLFAFVYLNIFSNDTIYVENYKLDNGRYKDQIYAGWWLL